MYRFVSLVAGVAMALCAGTAAAQVDGKWKELRSSTDAAARERLAPAATRQRIEAMRSDIKQRGKDYTVGYTTAMDLPLDQLAGTRIPRDLSPQQLRIASLGAQLSAIDAQRFEELRRINPDLTTRFASTCSASRRTWDWRTTGKVTSVKAQICGTCWDFTALGTYEASYAIRNNQQVDTSEQHILNCSGAGSCAGGWWGPVFDYMVTQGTASEAAVPFTGNDGLSCPVNVATPYRVSAWGFVNAASWQTPPTVTAMKQALCTHGPLATALFVSPQFQAYTGGGTFDQTDQTFNWINHGVVIVGWDDDRQAWIIKNSWGTGWGGTAGHGTERGYMWIRYGSNNIGVATAWVDAARRFYKLPIEWQRVLERQRIPLRKPIPEPDPVLIRQLKVTPVPVVR